MTSRGSLAYYLAAWVCGSFFMALAFWSEVHWPTRHSSETMFRDVGFLGLCFFGLILGAVPSLLFGWILRRLSRLLRAENVWVWVAAGAVLAMLLIGILGGTGRLARDPRFLPYSALPIWPFLLVGPLAILDGNIWVSLPVGAATASVLYAVDRAFTREVEKIPHDTSR
jgi:hypothetical protein